MQPREWSGPPVGSVDPGEAERPVLLPVGTRDRARQLLEEANMLEALVFRKQISLHDPAGLDAPGLKLALKLCGIALLNRFRNRGVERRFVPLSSLARCEPVVRTEVRPAEPVRKRREFLVGSNGNRDPLIVARRLVSVVGSHPRVLVAVSRGYRRAVLDSDVLRCEDAVQRLALGHLQDRKSVV